MNFFAFLKKFGTEEDCIKHFISVRYPQGAICNHCGNKTTYRRGGSKNFDCKACNNTFSVFKGTIFEKSCTDLRKWFFAIHLFLNGKKRISALQLQREISVTYKTAWRILHKIREAMGKDNDDDDDFTGLTQGITEADETYVGGKEENKHKHKKFTSVKSIVFGMINRDTQKAKAFVVESAKYYDLSEHIIKNIEMGSTLITDEHSSYRTLKTYYKHKTICHSAKEYVRSDIHTNLIESFWSTLKRSIYGIYHWASKKHLQNYVNGFASDTTTVRML